MIKDWVEKEMKAVERLNKILVAVEKILEKKEEVKWSEN